MSTIDYSNYFLDKIKGRYITLKEIEPLILNLTSQKNILGHSFKNRPIYKVQLGTGSNKVLIWSQMHGNESTGTKAIFDLINFLENPLPEDIKLRDNILSNTTIIIIPMLNPDGAIAYTRGNAQKIDLNRDAVALTAPESILLNDILNDFKPDYCFNLHDQRSLFSVGKDNLPATISFLAPSEDIERNVTEGRKRTMKVIVAMKNTLDSYIPNQIGRYTDEFYPTATGDNFQKAGYNTILIEAGHFPNDYQREKTREFNFLALVSGIQFISSNYFVDYSHYFEIPNNEKKYFEFYYPNIVLNDKPIALGVYFQDFLINQSIVLLKKHEIINIDTIVFSSKTIDKKLTFNTENEIVTFLKNNK